MTELNIDPTFKKICDQICLAETIDDKATWYETAYYFLNVQDNKQTAQNYLKLVEQNAIEQVFACNNHDAMALEKRFNTGKHSQSIKYSYDMLTFW